MATQAEFDQMIKSGELIESRNEMTPDYLKELKHTLIAYHILEELGEDQEKLIFSREPKSFRYPYAFDVPLDTWTELVVANGMYDQAGFCLLGDIHDKCSYGPWKRGLNKVMAEENSPLTHAP